MFLLGLASKMKPLRNLVMHVWQEWRQTAFNLPCRHSPSWWSQVEMGKNEQAYNTLGGHLLRPEWDTSLFSFFLFFCSTFLFLPLFLSPPLSFCLWFLQHPAFKFVLPSLHHWLQIIISDNSLPTSFLFLRASFWDTLPKLRLFP